MSAATENSKGLSFAAARSEAQFFGIASAILLVLILVVPIKIVKAFALLGIAVTGWQLLFHGSTALSITLNGEARRRFQVGVCLIVPAILSLYFIKNATSVSLEGLLGHMLSAWYIVPLVIIGYVSWAATDYLDQEHPFRGFLVSVAVLFVICFMGHNGIYSEYDDWTQGRSTFIDKEAARRAAETGRYFGQFLVYVAVSYLAMFLKLCKRRPTNQISPQAR
jgi:hypothetical protein